MKSLTYRPEIDGLRALAVVPVILFHLGLPWLSGGFLGVDIFFVISGYLITSIIQREVSEGTFSFKAFWLRRIRRIIPALLVMLTVTALTGYFLCYAPDTAQLGRQALAAFFSFANVYLWRLAGDYWGVQAESSAFLHTWSLSVEEQFYFFFPFLYLLVAKRWSQRLLPVLIGLTVGSVLIFLFGSMRYPDATFYLLPTRAWEIGCGAVLALVAPSSARNARFSLPLPEIGLFMIVASYFLIDGRQGVTPWMITPVLGAAMMISGSPQSPALRALSWKPVVHIGKMSYSLYLWHWPVILLAGNVYANGRPVISIIWAVFGILLLGWLSYIFVEGLTRHHPRLYAPLALVSLMSLSMFLWMGTRDRQEDVTQYSSTVWDGQLYNVAPVAAWTAHNKQTSLTHGIESPSRGDEGKDSHRTGGIRKLYGGRDPQVVVLGDSHAIMWSGILDEIFVELKLSVSFLAADGTVPFFDIPVTKESSISAIYFTAGEMYEFNRSKLEQISAWKPKMVLISARWSLILNTESARRAVSLVEFLQKQGTQVIFLGEPPTLFFGTRNAPQYLAHMKLIPQLGEKQFIPLRSGHRRDEASALLNGILQNRPYCQLLEIADLYMGKEAAWVLDGKDVLFIDDNHLSHAGASKAKSRIKAKIEQVFAGNRASSF
jgi:peptidoglycan/LPS O-acetylase OafA/YrhL